MSRPLRIEYENAYYHVMNRGRGRKRIFHDETYFHAFLDTLSEAHERFGLEVHAYCLMSNHYHLLVKTPQANLQSAMRHIGSIYTQRHNSLKKTDGPLFRGRYKAILIDHDAYLLHLSKYIHRNPIEAKIVKRLEDYPWSSYPSYIGSGKPPPWLYQDEVYGQLTTSRQKKRRYQAYVTDETLPETLVDFYNRERLPPVLGDDGFAEHIRAALGDLSQEASYHEKQRLKPSIEKITSIVSDYYKITNTEIMTVKKGRGMKNQPRKLAMYLAQHIGGYRLSDIAEAFGLSHYGGVSNAISMLKEEMEENAKLRRSINTIINRLDP